MYRFSDSHVLNVKKTKMRLNNHTINKLKELRISAKDYNRVLYPLESRYHFTVIDKKVKIMRAYEALPPNIYKKLIQIHTMCPFEKNQCHLNCLVAGLNLSDYGIRIVDGYYTCKLKNETAAHSFLEYNGKYFDITIEYGSEYFDISMFEYHANRVFTPQERLTLSCAISYLMDNELELSICGGIINNYELLYREMTYGGYSHAYFLNDDGMLEHFECNNIFPKSAA